MRWRLDPVETVMFAVAVLVVVFMAVFGVLGMLWLASDYQSEAKCWAVEGSTCVQCRDGRSESLTCPSVVVRTTEAK